jgi:WD40 repeat protein
MMRVLHIESKKVVHAIKMKDSFANDLQFSSDGRHLALALGNSVQIFTFETMKRTHSYNPTNSKVVITKMQWHPQVDKLQICTCDM